MLLLRRRSGRYELNRLRKLGELDFGPAPRLLSPRVVLLDVGMSLELSEDDRELMRGK